MLKKWLAIFLLVIVLAFGLGANAFAQETDYPDLPGAESPEEGTSLPQFIIYLFNFGLFIGTVIATGALILGGILYLTAGSSIRAKQARDRVKYAFFGLLILFSSYLLLNTINPELTIFSLPELPDSPDSEPFDPGEDPEPRIDEYQEMPIGTLLEKVVAKNIGCYKDGDVNNEMIDCQDNKKVTVGPIDDYDARKGYCYDFDDEGNFKDANKDTDQIDPMTEHDRLDCIKKFQKPVNVRMEKLKEWSEDLRKEILKQCKCSNCKKEGCECASKSCPGPCNCTKLECIGKPYNNPAKDPCASRKPIDKIRRKIRRNYTDEELKQMTVKKFKEKSADTQEYGKDTVLVADQVRFLMVNFLKPLEKDLKNDLHYLRKVEDTLKNKCPYQLIFNYPQFFKKREEAREGTIKRIKFCETDSEAQWGEECSEQDQTEIVKYFEEFNCVDCWKDDPDNKLPCGKCNLDVLEQGEEVPYTVGSDSRTTYKCSGYDLNNEKGEDFSLEEGCETTDEKCKLGKIEDEEGGDTKEEECTQHNDDPATFYCPKIGTDLPPSGVFITNNIYVNPDQEEGYPKGLIPIGKAVDQGEKLGQEILDELENINKKITQATDALFNPNEEMEGKLKEPAGDPDVLYSHPLGCMCEADPGYYQFPGNCVPICTCFPTVCPIPCGPPPLLPCQTKCGTCVKKCTTNPCPMGKINEKVGIVKNSEKSIRESFERIIDLILERNLKEDDPERTEIINKLQDSRSKMERCVTGFEQTQTSERVLRRFLSCYSALDLIKLDKILIKPGFPIPEENEICYPYNSEELSNNQSEQCLNNIEGDDCEQAIEGIGENGAMNNFFCGEE